MKITIEPTDAIVEHNGRKCRIWQGVTENGVLVTAGVAMLCALFEEGQSDAEFQQLKEMYEPQKVDRNRTTGN